MSSFYFAGILPFDNARDQSLLFCFGCFYWMNGSVDLFSRLEYTIEN